jgi:type IV pilus assembly protein PilA
LCPFLRVLKIKDGPIFSNYSKFLLMAPLYLYLIRNSIKNKTSQGFTLIELLVVIIIVGLLSAIALPSYLNQAGKTKGAEAKSSLGTINRSQQSYRLENNTMANGLALLDAKISGKFYLYTVTAASADVGNTTTATTQADLKAYASRAEQAGDIFRQTICESNDVVAAGGAIAVPSAFNTCAVPASQKVIQ